MVTRRVHAVDELAVVRQQQQAGCVLVQPPNGLHALHRALLRPLAQRRRQQRVDAGIGRRLLRALGAGGLVQHHISLVMEFPILALDLEAKALGIDIGCGIAQDLATNRDQPLLNQPRTDPAGSEPL